VDTIFVEAIEFYGYHGASDEEQVVGHRYAVDVALEVDTRRAGGSDCLADTVNYATVARRVVEIGTGERCRLIEALAERLADAILREFGVGAVRVRVRKLHPPMNVIAARVGV
jgi:dihydroneopterin aldolase